MPILRSRVRFPVIPLSLPKFLFDSNVPMKPSLIGLYGERPLKLNLIRIVRIHPDQLKYLSVLIKNNNYNGQQVLTVSPR